MKSSENFAVVIPARYQSSRFPGKPLVKICGKPMIQHVWERCCVAVGTDKVYVATDDDRIEAAVAQFNGQSLRTSSNCLTGTDRLAEANKHLGYDFIINVQGDEPVIDPDNIITVIERFKQTGNVTNAYCEILSEEEFRSLTVPKVVNTCSGRLLYMSRSSVPLTKDGEFRKAYKQVCIYAFTREHLEFFASHPKKTPLEQIEDIEILRFLESGYSIDMVEVPSGSAAVDVPSDVEKVAKLMQG